MDIKRKIRERGFTLEEVGNKMQKKMSQQSMSALLKDGANPSINKLREIAIIIGVPLSELVSDADDVSHSDSFICPHCGTRFRLVAEAPSEPPCDGV